MTLVVLGLSSFEEVQRVKEMRWAKIHQEKPKIKKKQKTVLSGTWFIGPGTEEQVMELSSPEREILGTPRGPWILSQGQAELSGHAQCQKQPSSSPPKAGDPGGGEMGLGFQGQQWEAWRSRGRVAHTPGEGPEPSELLGMTQKTRKS